MKKLAFVAAAVFTTLAFVSSEKIGVFNTSLQPKNDMAQTADLNNDVNQLAPTAIDRANLAQADGKVNY